MERYSYDRRPVVSDRGYPPGEPKQLVKVIRDWVSPETPDEWVEKLKNAYLKCESMLDGGIKKVIEHDLKIRFGDDEKARMLKALFGFRW